MSTASDHVSRGSSVTSKRIVFPSTRPGSETFTCVRAPEPFSAALSTITKRFSSSSNVHLRRAAAAASR